MRKKEKRQLAPIVSALAEIYGRDFVLEDFSGISASNHPLHEMRSIFWVVALEQALLQSEKSEPTGKLWAFFGELLTIGFGDDGPIYVSKATASPEHVSAAINYVTSRDGAVQ